MANAGNRLTNLRGAILRDVSRSFYLSIRILPAALREPIALAYLLARATDTIADTAEISPALRTEALGKLAALIQGEKVDDAAASFSAFAARQQDRAERLLIESLANCLDWLEAMAPEDRADIREVLVRINQGQALDVERFADPAQVHALAAPADLEHYTYLVAGCVGEFWTKICFRHLRNFSQRSRAEMLSLGKEYGQGLQLVNILRDAGADLRAGRCYLPAEELRARAISPNELLSKAEAAQPVVRRWREQAERGMKAGIEYACAIRSWRVRLATVLPALIGVRTLALLRDAGSRAFAERIKVPRAEVRRILFGAIRTLASPRYLRKAV